MDKDKKKKKLAMLKKPELTSEERKNLVKQAHDQMMEFKDEPSRLKKILEYLKNSPVSVTIGSVASKDDKRDAYLKDLID